MLGNFNITMIASVTNFKKKFLGLMKLVLPKYKPPYQVHKANQSQDQPYQAPKKINPKIKVKRCKVILQ